MNPVHSTRHNPILFHATDAGAAAVVSRAMARARTAQVHWARTALPERLGLVRELRHLMVEHAEQLAEASALARQRPAREALVAEVLPLVEACRFLEREAGRVLAVRRLGKRGLPLWLTGVHSEVRLEPLGIVLVIGPGNYPLFLPGVQVLQALAAGNAVLLKPGGGGSRAARFLFDLLLQAGVAPGLFTVLGESVETAQAAIAAQPDKVLFTGAAETGEQLLAQLAPRLVPATLELSGCDAVIVRGDADVELAAKALAFGLTLNRGATCMCPRRVFVCASRATELEGRLAEVLRRQRGHEHRPNNPGSNSLASVTAERLTGLVEDALTRGAHVIAGTAGENGVVTLPLVLGGVAPESRLLREDLFAPVLALVTVQDDIEAVARANDCPLALGASIFSRDESTARQLVERIRGGIVTINDVIIPTADARVPFGGRARSGFGVTRGPEGLLELTAPKVVTVTRAWFRPAFEPAQPGDTELFTAYLKLAHGRSLKARWGALNTVLRTIWHRRNSSPKNNS